VRKVNNTVGSARMTMPKSTEAGAGGRLLNGGS
jgi:hypothetical protein